MRYRNNTSGIIINYTFSISFFLLVFMNVNAQKDCQNKLEEYNQRTIFPSEQLPEYERCLDNVGQYYYTLFPEQKNVNTKIANLKTELKKIQDDLTRAKQNKDSINIVIYSDKEFNKKKEIDDSNGKLEKNKNEIISYKATLKKSYTKIIAYYTSIENPKSRDWQKKSDTFTAFN